jgi:hypothetical protein
MDVALTRLLMGATLLLTGPAVAPALAGDLPSGFEQAAGSWRGRGTARDTPKDMAESVSCRATNTLAEAKLKISATCLAASGEGQLNAFLEPTAAGDIDGVWYRTSSRLAAEERGDLTGTAEEHGLTLQVTAAGRLVATVALAFPGDNAMHLTVTAPPAEGSVTLVDVAFTR